MNPRLNPIAITTLATLLCAAAPRLLASESLATCAAIDDDPRRLACYDELAGRAIAAAAPAPADADALADFGLSATAKRERDPERWTREQPPSIEGRIAKAERNPNGRFVLTLDNRQVWMQAETKPGIVLRPGDAVTIKRAAMGSFMLVNRYGIATRMRRVR